MKFVVYLILCLALVFPAAAVFADSSGPGGNAGGDSSGPGNGGDQVQLINPLKGIDCDKGKANGDCLNSFLLSILDLVIRIGSIVVVLMLVYTGYKFVVARGNASELEEARRMLLWTIIGALILLGAQAIALGINATVNALKVGS